MHTESQLRHSLEEIECSAHCHLTNQPQDEQELGGVLVEAEVGRLGVHDGANQAAFGCEEA